MGAQATSPGDMFYAAMYALKGRENRRAAAALSQLSSVDLGGRPAAHAAARTQALASSSSPGMMGTVPAVPDCGLFGTECDGNSYLTEARSTHRTPSSYHLSP